MEIHGSQTLIIGVMKLPTALPKYDYVSYFLSPTHLTAVQAIWGQTPNYTREGGSIPVTLTFAENMGVNVLLLPMGRGDDGAQ